VEYDVTESAEDSTEGLEISQTAHFSTSLVLDFTKCPKMNGQNRSETMVRQMDIHKNMYVGRGKRANSHMGLPKNISMGSDYLLYKAD